MRSLLLVNTLFCCIFISCEANVQYKAINPTSFHALNTALQVCSADLRIADLEKRYLTARIYREPQKIIDSLEDATDQLVAYHEDAVKRFKAVTFNQNDPNSRRNEIFFYLTDCIFKAHGFQLSITEKYALFKDLSKETGYQEYGAFMDFEDSLKNPTYIDSAVIKFADRISLDWQGLNRNQHIQLKYLLGENIDFMSTPYFPISYQSEDNNCGPTCLKMISDYYGRFYPVETFEQYSRMSKTGTSMRKMMEACDSVGLKAKYYEKDYEGFKALNQFPCIVRWLDVHYVVVYHANDEFVWIADPDRGCRKLTSTNFTGHWLHQGVYPLKEGSILTVQTTAKFYD